MTSPLVQNIIDDFHGYREPAAALDATVDYVKFSRDQFILDCPSEKLRRELEEELKMNCEEPRSHAWYHGAIPRQVAENLVQRDGDFLVRDSLSSPGSYVLTCQWRNAAQHFKINKKVVMLNEAYSRVEYRLEREGFDSVPALIRYYVGNRKSVSQVIGAIIFQPINRALPLRCLEEKYGLSGNHREAGLTAQERRSQKRLSLNITNGHSHDNKHNAHDGSHCQDNGIKCWTSTVVVGPGQAIRGSDSQLCPKPPPKPSKVPLARLPRSPSLENTSEEEEDDIGRDGEEEDEDERKEKGGSSFQRPVIETESAFRPAEFGSRLLPTENKPLEMVVLKRAKELLLSHDHQSIAKHLLMADCLVGRILGVTPELKGQMGVASGLELVTLPHGRQLRLDLMERHHTMAIGVAVDILGCTGSVEERASTLNRIILVAMELKDAVGDLFAFTALMKALDLPQISRLEETWTTLRRNFTQTAINYEKILKPFYKNLYEGTASCPLVVCVPLLLPLLTLMERPSITPEGAELWETSDQGCDIMLRHLEAARDVAQNSQGYTANAQEVLQGFECDEDLLEVFKTDFQLRLLWGSRGAAVNQSDRYNKFNLILTALSRKLEPPPKTQTLI
uniref:Breast cancer anti-estrogen resistance protein 3-like n=1 Tax=Sphaeramia orbicularis TaxID=375764 RepID=A0A672Y907_9TELE